MQEIEILEPQIKALSAYEQLPTLKRRFVDAYVVHGEVRPAYFALFPGASDASMGYRWAADPMIAAAVAERTTSHVAQTAITLQRVLSEIGNIAIGSIKNYIKQNDAGQVELYNGLPMLDFSRVTDEQWAAVAEINFDETTNPDKSVTRKVKLKLHDKSKALDQLMKRWGAYAPQEVNHTINGRIEEVITVSATPQEASEQYARMLKGPNT